MWTSFSYLGYSSGMYLLATLLSSRNIVTNSYTANCVKPELICSDYLIMIESSYGQPLTTSNVILEISFKDNESKKKPQS